MTHTTPFALTFDPTEGTRDWLPRLAVDHDLVIVTARESEALANAERWLDALGLTPCITEIHSSFGPTKSALAGDLNLDCFVDDLATTFEAWPAKIPSLLWDASYNRSDQLPIHVERIDGWPGLADWLAHH